MDTTNEFRTVATLPSVKDESQHDDRSDQDDLEKQSVHDTASSKAVAKQHPTKDPNIVDWDGPEDKENPMNWPLKKKITNIGIVSVLTFLSYVFFVHQLGRWLTSNSPLGSTVTSPASADIMETFHSTKKTIESFVTSVYLLGYVFGPLALAPLSRLYGRAIVYNVYNFGFLIWNIACALANNLSSLIVFRLLAGPAGSAPMTIGAETIADMVPLEKRGLAMMGWILGPVLGPTFGPLSEIEPNAVDRTVLRMISCWISCSGQGLAMDFLVGVDTGKLSASKMRTAADIHYIGPVRYP